MNPAYKGVKFRYLILWTILTIAALSVGGLIYVFQNNGEGIMSIVIFSQFALYGVAFLWLKRAYRKNQIDMKSLFQPIRKSDQLVRKTFFTLFHLTFSLAAVSFLFYLFSFIVPDYLLDLLEDNDSTNAFVNSTKVSSFFLIVLVAPVVEELLFRGTLLQKLRVKYGNVAGILISSALFSLIHMNSGMIGHFTIGIFLSIFYLKTQNIWVPIICHALNNLVAFLTLTTSPSESTNITETIAELQMAGPYIGVYAMICLIFMGWLAVKMIKDINHTTKLDGEQSMNQSY